MMKIISFFKSTNERRQLLRLALVTSPLLAVFRIAPAVILDIGEIQEKLPDFISENGRIVFAAFVIASNIFIHWTFNIWLLTKEEKHQENKQKWQPKYFFSYLFSLSTVGIPMLIVTILDLPIAQNSPFSFYPFVGTIANNTVILLIINLVITRNRKSQLELQNMQLEMSNLMAQQEQLKHQLQPHFLFNALYTLRLLIQKKPKQAEQYLNHLSTFLRASLQHSKQDKITVKEELAFCLDYLALQKVRFGEALQYEVDISEQLQEEAALPIFTLQLLAENAIKHNAFSANNPLELSIYACEEGWIHVKNNIIPKRQQSESTGIGLSNLKERFRLLTSKDVRVEIIENQQYFLVHLPTLPL